MSITKKKKFIKFIKEQSNYNFLTIRSVSKKIKKNCKAAEEDTVTVHWVMLVATRGRADWLFRGVTCASRRCLH